MVYACTKGFPHEKSVITLLNYTDPLAKVLSINLFITGSR